MNRLQKVGATVRRRRKELGYSQERFAAWAGIERARYGRIERGELNLTLEKYFELAGHLMIEPYRLMKDISLDDCLLADVDEKDG